MYESLTVFLLLHLGPVSTSIANSYISDGKTVHFSGTATVSCIHSRRKSKSMQSFPVRFNFGKILKHNFVQSITV